MKSGCSAQVHGDGDRYEFETDFIIRAARAGFTTAFNVPNLHYLRIAQLFPGIPGRVARDQSAVAPRAGY